MTTPESLCCLLVDPDGADADALGRLHTRLVEQAIPGSWSRP